jgi:hypothetical protein
MVSEQKTLLFQGFKVIVHAIGGLDPEKGADLAERWWETPLANRSGDVIENLALSVGEFGWHEISLGSWRFLGESRLSGECTKKDAASGSDEGDTIT